MAIETVDALELTIQSDASKAAEEINKLAASVSNFGENVQKYLASMTNFATSLRSIVDAAGSLDGVKNIKSIMQSAAMTASKAKTATIGKAFTPIIPPMKSSDSIRGRTRYANWSDGTTRKFNASSDDLARQLISQFNPDTSKAALSGQIQEIRNLIIRGEEQLAMQMIQELSNEISNTAKTANRGALVNGFNRYFGKGELPLTQSQRDNIIGQFDSIKAANARMREIGVLARFANRASKEGTTIDQLWEGRSSVSGDVDVSVGLDEGDDLRLAMASKDMAGNSSFTDLIAAMDHEHYDRHAKWLDEYALGNMDIARSEVFGELVDKVYGSSVVEDQLAPVKEAIELEKRVEAEEMASAVNSVGGKQFFDTFNKRLGIGNNWKGSAEQSAKVFGEMQEAVARERTVISETEQVAGDKKIYGSNVRNFDEYTGKDWRAENAEDTAYFNQRLTEILSAENALKNIRDAVKDMKPGEGANADNHVADIAPRIAEARSEVENLNSASKITASEFMDDVNATDILQMKLDSVGEKLEEAVNSENYDPGKVAQLAEQYNRLRKKIQEVGDVANKTGSKAGGLRRVFSAIGKTIERSLIGQLARVAKMRALRWIVKEAAAGLKEGVSNMYQWSKGLGGSFASALDTAASKSMLFKNSLATAIAPALQALIPVLSTVVSWVNAACNALSQFMALLTGSSTWTKATETAEEWAAATKSGASGAGSAVKDLLADFDELNVIQSETGGGGGGSSGKKTADYANMFEEMTVFDEWAKYFDEIKATVIAIGAGIAGWFVMSQVEDFLAKIGIAGKEVSSIFSRIKKGIAGAVLLTIGFSLASAAGKDMANNGFTWKNALTAIGSAVASGLGGYLLASAIGISGYVGAIVGLTAAAFIGIKAYVDERNNNAKDYIRARLTNEIYGFDVYAVAEDLEVVVANADQARKETRAQLERVLTTMDVIKLGIDKEKSWDTLYKQIMDGDTGLIHLIRSELEQDRNVITFYYQLQQKTAGSFGEKDENGDYKNLDAFKIDMGANSWLDEYYAGLGEKFAECFTTGEVKKIKEGKEEVAAAIANQIAEGERAAELARGEAEAKVGVINALKGTDKKTILANMGSTMEEYEEKLASVRKEAAEAYYVSESATLARLIAAGADQDLIDSVRARVDEVQRELENADYKAQVHLEVAENEKSFILDFLNESFDKNGSWQRFETRTVQDSIRLGGTAEEMSQRLSWQLTEAANEYFGLKAGSTLFKDFGIGLADILGETVIQGLKDEITQKKGDSYANEVLEYLGLSGKSNAGDVTGANWQWRDLKGVSSSAGISDVNYVSAPSTTGYEQSGPINVNAAASGMAMDSTMESGFAGDKAEMKALEGIMQRMQAILNGIERYSRITANKDWTVNVNPSTGFARNMNQSAGKMDRVTGAVTMPS